MIKNITRRQNFNCVEVFANNELFNYCWGISKNNNGIKEASITDTSKELLQLALFVILLKNFHDKNTRIKYNDKKFKKLVEMLNNSIFKKF